MSQLILPPGFNKRTTPKAATKAPLAGNFVVKNMTIRAKYWHDYEYPGDVAHALVRAEMDHRKPPVPTPEQCPNRDCRVCHPNKEDQDRIDRGHHI